MRIAHFPLNIAGYASRLVAGQRKLGHEAIVYSRSMLPYNFPADVTLPSHTDPVRFNLSLFKKLPELATFDIVHVHGGVKRFELGYYALRGPKVFIHYHGTETRRGFGLYHQRLADGYFYTPPDLKPYLPKSTVWLPQPIDLTERPAEMFEHDVPVFVHFSRPLKGTAQVIEMFDKAFGPIRHARLDFPQGGHKDFYISDQAELWVLSDIPHDDVESVMKRADAVFDQIAPYGIYGYVSIEAMALGRPALATVDYALYPSDCPVIYPTLAVLRKLAFDETLRRRVGEKGRRYVERVHESTIVARKVLDAYEREGPQNRFYGHQG